MLEMHKLSGYKAKPYAFVSPEAEARFNAGTNRSSGVVVLWDLVRLAKEEGCSVPEHLNPRSVYRPEMLITPMMKYLQGGIMGDYDASALHQAYRRVARAFFVGKLKPVQLERCNYRSDTSSGAPLFMKKGDCIDQALREAYAIRNGRCPPPLTVYHRGKNQEVVRPVFGYPFSMTLLETRFFEPFQFEIIGHHNPYIGGRSYSAVSSDINEIRWSSNLVYALDYSSFDGSISAKLVSLAFNVIEANFDLSEGCDLSDWNLVRKYFVTAPMLMPNGEMIVGRRHGVPSGSMFTQIIDSIVNAIVIEYSKIRLGYMTSRYYVLGDDSIIGVIGIGPAMTDLKWVMSELGIHLNVEKSRAQKAAVGKQHFLGHYWHRGVMSREISDTWDKLLCPERIDQRIFSKNENLRRQAWLERLRAYQDDNVASFEEIQLVINRLTRKPCDATIMDFVPGLAYRERMWDLSVSGVIQEAVRRPRRYTRFLYACS